MMILNIINTIVCALSVGLALHSVKYFIKSKRLSDKIIWGLIILIDLSNICLIISLYV